MFQKDDHVYVELDDNICTGIILACGTEHYRVIINETGNIHSRIPHDKVHNSNPEIIRGIEEDYKYELSDAQQY